MPPIYQNLLPFYSTVPFACAAILQRYTRKITHSMKLEFFDIHYISLVFYLTLKTCSISQKIIKKMKILPLCPLF